MRQQPANRYFIFMGLIMVVFSVGCKINKIHCGAFYVPVAPKTDSVGNRNFVVKEDGTKVFGDDVWYKYGIVIKNEVIIDGKKFKFADVKGYQKNGVYYARIGNRFVKRIVHGKLNVYIEEYWSTRYHGVNDNIGRPVMRCIHYVQQGETGKLVSIANQKNIKKFVGDCPKSFDMINKNNSKIRKALRRDPKYLNKIFEYYNAGNCSTDK